MSSHYTTEPAPTASATLNTTFGPVHLALFAKQTPFTSRNFLQHCLDNYYAGTIFHRVVPDFIIQGGDPTGTGSGGTSIYEDPQFEYDPDNPTDRIVLKDELHSRLRFNRRGLLGMAKAEDGSYGSQFFITLANTERELNGQCTLFGRVEGDSIFNVLKIADAERVDGSDRPVYPVKITSCEVGELGPLAGKLVKRQLTAVSHHGRKEEEEEKKTMKKRKKPNLKAAKALLSFDDDLPDDLPVNKPIYKEDKSKAKEPSPSPPTQHIAKTPKPMEQLPLPNPEEPEENSPSPSPSRGKESSSFLSRTNKEIETVKNSMRRNTAEPSSSSSNNHASAKSALDNMIPETAIRGRKRRPQHSTDNETLRMFNAFRAKLDHADNPYYHSDNKHDHVINKGGSQQPRMEREEQEVEEEAEEVCDLHFIVNCESCRSWENNNNNNNENANGNGEEENESGWLTHQLRFGKDTLGKDLSWKREHPDDVDSLMVIDPREKEKDILQSRRRKRGEDDHANGEEGNKNNKKSSRMSERERERERKLEKINSAR